MSTARTQETLPRKQGGFTLVELMITLIIIVILSTAALPFYKAFITTQRIKSASFDMMAMFIFTRNEAMKRNANVTLNGGPGGFTITLQNGTVLRQQSAFTGIQIDCVNMATTPHSYMNCPAAGLVYNGNGRLQGGNFPPVELHVINAGDATTANFRCLTIDLSGRPNSKKGPC